MEIEEDSLFQQIQMARVDSKNNVYVTDYTACKIHKFDSKGVYVKSFGGRGQGPGEFTYISALIICNDILYVPQNARSIMVKYDTDGKYLGDVIFPSDAEVPINFNKSDSLILGRTISSIYDQKTQTSTDSHIISMYDKDLNKLDKSIAKREFKEKRGGDIDPYMTSFSYAINDKKAFIAQNSYDKYKIFEYNTSGDLVRVINKNCTKTKLPDEIIHKFNEINKKHNTKYKVKYTPIIDEVFADKYDRLWVLPNAESNIDSCRVYDIFKDGVYLNTDTLNIPQQSKIYTSNGKIVVFVRKDVVSGNAKQKVIVYDY